MNLKFTFNNSTQNITFGKINVIYGYNNSGKSYLLNTLYEGFNQKNKGIFQVNGFQSMKSDYETLKIDRSITLEDQLKMGAKSFLRKTYLSKFVEVIDHDDFSNYIFEKLTNNEPILNEIIEPLNSLSNNKITVNFDIQSIEDYILNNIKIDVSDKFISESDQALLIYNIAIEYLNKSRLHKILFIDDFDCKFDFANTVKFINTIDKLDNYTIFLFTSNPQSIEITLSRYNVFNIRENKVYDLSNIKKIINASIIDSSDTNLSIEDYIISNKILITNSEYADLTKEIKRTAFINLGRMLTNKLYSFANPLSDAVTIYPFSDFESNLLKYIDALLNNNN